MRPHKYRPFINDKILKSEPTFLSKMLFVLSMLIGFVVVFGVLVLIVDVI